MKIFFSFTTILFALVTLLPFVNVFFGDIDEMTPYLNKVCPIYLPIGIVGMLTMAYMGDKYENKI
jgi:uncharacterized membrane protein